MKPLLLRIKGFFSYYEEASIDFKNLWDAGFFGLLGPTGAGKSSLIEAMLIALYGTTARLRRIRKNASPASNFLNTRSRSGYIELTFVTRGKTYCASYMVGEGESPQHRLYDEQKNLLACDKAVPGYVEELLGLSYEHFALAFVLQQGEFQTFLTGMNPAARSAILKDLLHLHMPDAHEAIKNALSLIKNQVEERTSELNQAREYLSRVEVDTLPGRIQELRTQLEENKKRRQKAEENLRILTSYKKALESLQSYQDKLNELEKEKDQYDRIQNQIQLYRQVREALQVLKAQESDLHNRIDSQERDKEESARTIRDIEKRVDELSSELQVLQPEYGRREKHRERLEALARLDEYRSLKENVDKLSQRISNGETVCKKQETLIKQLNEEQEALMKQEKSLKTELEGIPEGLILWYNEREAYRKRLEDLIREQKQTQQHRERAEKALQTLLEEIVTGEELPLKLPVPSDEWEDIFQHIERSLRERLNELLLQTQAAQLAETLREGEACPVCGSIHHPAKAQPPLQLERRRQLLETDLDRMSREGKKMLSDFLYVWYREKGQKERCTQEETMLRQYDESFLDAWYQPGFKPETSEAMVFLTQRRQTLQQKITDIQQQLARKQNDLREARESLDRYNKALTELKNQQAEETARCTGIAEGLQKVLGPELLKASPDEVTHERERLSALIVQLERYPELEKEERALRNDLHTEQGKMRERERQIHDLRSELRANLTLQEEAIQKLGLNRDEAERYYNMSPEKVEADERRVRDFTDEVNKYRNLIESVRYSASMYNDEIYRQSELELRTLEEESDDMLRRLIEMERLQEEAAAKKIRVEEIEDELARLRPRYEGYTFLSRLFQKDAFDQFVLRKEFEWLVVRANQYLMDWSGGRLQLEVAPNELDLYIRDLWEARPAGKERGVLTLSGGQTFEASLALALALADSIHRHADMKEAMLFIDEGFGTLDGETLGRVVRTLHARKSRGLKVGVITHREELQQLLDAVILVREEKGTTRLYPSWERVSV